MDGGSREPGTKFGALYRINGEKTHGGIETDITERLCDARILRAIETRLQLINVNFRGAVLAQQKKIVARAVNRVRPDGAAGEDVEESGDFALHGFFVAFVERNPLRDDASRIQMFFHHLKIFLGIKRGAAFHPGMNRIGSYNVKLIARGQNVMARVVVNNSCARSARDSV